MAKTTRRKSAARIEAARKRESRKQLKKYIPYAIAALVVVVIGAAVISSQLGGDPDEGEGFRVEAYQGQDEIGGQQINFKDLLAKGRPVVLNFWAGNCPPCRQEMPGFQRVYEQHRGEFILIGVDVGPFMGLGSHDDARAFLEEFGITYPTAFALSRDPIREYEVLSMPTTVFFNAQGFVFSRHSGFLPEDQLREQIEALLSTVGEGQDG